jgi:hypothetical protein
VAKAPDELCTLREGPAAAKGHLLKTIVQRGSVFKISLGKQLSRCLIRLRYDYAVLCSS